MAEEILNRVALSKLIVIDLEDYYVEGERMNFDLKDWLYEGFVLREKDFRQKIKEHDWSKYQDKYVALDCSTDAIVPAWAYTLLSLQLSHYTKFVVKGNLENLESLLYTKVIDNFDVEPYQDKPIILKGCSNKPVPLNAYIQLANKLRPVAKSIMYGEACSAVPLYKQRSLN